MTTSRKENKREARREEKSEKAALMERVIYSSSVRWFIYFAQTMCGDNVSFLYFICQAIESELVERLKKYMVTFTTIRKNNSTKFLAGNKKRLLARRKKTR